MPDNTKTLKAASEVRKLIVKSDVVDLRDRYYSPSLNALPQSDLPEASELFIRDQHEESACTGFALAAVIDRQRQRAGQSDFVSARMLFEMARLHDDLPESTQPGSTLRGALKGFFHNGVCSEKDEPFLQTPGSPPWELSVDSALKAREITLGAYYRLNHEVSDYHDAIIAAGGIIASGVIHSGWANPPSGVIQRVDRKEGRHAFAIIGYTPEGFIVQNSWGENWGRFNDLRGVALWSYEDWFQNVEDAWVLRLAVSSPNAFDFKIARNHAIFRNAKPSGTAMAPRRLDIHGHYLHLDDGCFVKTDRYGQTAGSVDQTTELIEKGANDPSKHPPFEHLLIFAHGALSDKIAIAKRIRAWKNIYKKNGIYPIHIMWETAFNNDVVDVLEDLLFKTRKRMGESGEHLDARLEEMARPLGRKLWRDIKVTAGMCFDKNKDGGQSIRKLLHATAKKPQLKVHFASASAGALLLGELADVMAELNMELATASLMAPACNIEHYETRILPHLGKTIKALRQYTLIDSRERKDPLNIYSKSLLYLVSLALEKKDNNTLTSDLNPKVADHVEILGMEKGLSALVGKEKPRIVGPHHEVRYAGRDHSSTDAVSHRGFDSDPNTMNDILAHILGQKPAVGQRFSKAILSTY